MTSEILLTINSLLLGLVGVLLGFVGFFLKDLHKQFKALVDRVNNLYGETTRITTASTLHQDRNDEEIRALKVRVDRLEAKTNNQT